MTASSTRRRRLRLRTLAIHAGLFLAACATTTWSQGPAFSATLMGILVCHELGHYVVGRRHGVAVSLPYFIPLPPQVSLGTMGAVIRMDGALADRNRLLDVGAAGPIAGLVVALPLLVLGLTWSPLEPIPPGASLEGNSLLYLLLKYAVFGRWLPDGGVDVTLHPVAFAAWWGLLITMINLIPIGQLDGGHVMRAWLGDRHERVSARLHRALPVVGLAVAGWLAVEARAAGRGWIDTVEHAGLSALPWLVWTALLFAMRGVAGGAYHPPTDDVPLTPGRRRLAWLILLTWILLFTPVPMRQAL